MEFGSDFALSNIPELQTCSSLSSWFVSDAVILSVSGRSALYGILQQGIDKHGWEKVLIPSYYCHEVVHSIRNLEILIEYYLHRPFSSETLDFSDDSKTVVVNVDYFGVSKLDLSNYSNLVVIEDLTHSIGTAVKSTAHYCFGSLRKILPLPVGGFIFSPRALALPSLQTSNLAHEIAVTKLSAMELKRNYIEGHVSDKSCFRTLFSIGEHNLSLLEGGIAMPKMVVDLLSMLNIEYILNKKVENIGTLLSLLGDNRFIVEDTLKDSGFGLVLYFPKTTTRDSVRIKLIDNLVFPAVLWPLQVFAPDTDFSERMLYLHIDYRYDKEDMQTIVNIIKEALKDE